MEDKNFRRRLLSSSQDIVHLPEGYRKCKYIYGKFPDFRNDGEYDWLKIGIKVSKTIAIENESSIIVDCGSAVSCFLNGSPAWISQHKVKCYSDKSNDVYSSSGMSLVQFSYYSKVTDPAEEKDLNNLHAYISQYGSNYYNTDGSEISFSTIPMPKSIETARKDIFFVEDLTYESDLNDYDKSYNNIKDNDHWYAAFQHIIFESGCHRWIEDVLLHTDIYSTISNGYDKYNQQNTKVFERVDDSRVPTYNDLTLDLNNIVIFSIIAKENNKKVAHFVPCYSEKDKCYGLYDVIGNKFFTDGEEPVYRGYRGNSITGGNDLIYGGGVTPK